MASSFNATKILQAAMLSALATNSGLAAQAGKLVDTGGAGQLRLAQGAFGGTLGTLSSTATSVTPSDAFTYESTCTLVHKVLQHKLPKSTVTGDSGFADAGRQMAASLVATIDKTFFDGLEGLFGLAHPRVGTGAGQVGATKKYLDTGLAYLQGESGAGTQDNLITSALAEASLNTAIKLLIAQRSDRGVPLALGANGGLVLVVAPKNLQLAHELVRSQLSGSDMADNFVKGIISRIVCWQFTTDDDDWFLIDPMNCPVGVAWDSGHTDVRVSETTDGLFYEFTIEAKLAFFVSPYENGIIGANVA